MTSSTLEGMDTHGRVVSRCLKCYIDRNLLAIRVGTCGILIHREMRFSRSDLTLHTQVDLCSPANVAHPLDLCYSPVRNGNHEEAMIN
jgi:hypothetical protein